jgi:hypothetical protein
VGAFVKWNELLGVRFGLLVSSGSAEWFWCVPCEGGVGCLSLLVGGPTLPVGMQVHGESVE